MIDPTIALSGKPVQFDSAGILNMFQQGQQRKMQAQQLGMQQESHAQQMQAGALDLQEKQRQATEGQQLRDVFKPTVGPDGQSVMPDIRASIPKIMAINPNVGMAMQKSLHEQEKSALDLQKTQIEVSGKKAERFGSIAGTIKDETSFHDGITTALSEGLIKPDVAAQLLGQGWTPQTQAQVQQISQGAASVKEQHDMKLADVKAKQEALAAQHEAELHPLKVEEAQAKVSGDNRAQDAADLAAAAKQGPDALAYALQKLSEAGRVEPFMQVNAKTKPADILRIGMKPHEVASADAADKNAENNVSEYELELRAAKGDQFAKTALGNRQRDKLAQAAAGGAATRGLDHEIGQYGKPFDEIVKGADGQLDKILDAEKLVAGGAMSQAVAIPKILTALVSGQGSGVRITQAEMQAIAKARGIGGDVEGFFNRISGQGVLTDTQKQQMQAMLQDVRERIVQKKLIAHTVADEMQSATTREGVLAAAKKGRDGLDAHAAQGGNTGGGIPDAVKKVLTGTQPGVHTLSDGTRWQTAADGTITKL